MLINAPKPAQGTVRRGATTACGVHREDFWFGVSSIQTSQTAPADSVTCGPSLGEQKKFLPVLGPAGRRRWQLQKSEVSQGRLKVKNADSSSMVGARKPSVDRRPLPSMYKYEPTNLASMCRNGEPSLDPQCDGCRYRGTWVPTRANSG